jgi:hypothetical protein
MEEFMKERTGVLVEDMIGHAQNAQLKKKSPEVVETMASVRKMFQALLESAEQMLAETVMLGTVICRRIVTRFVLRC